MAKRQPRIGCPTLSCPQPGAFRWGVGFLREVWAQPKGLCVIRTPGRVLLFCVCPDCHANRGFRPLCKEYTYYPSLIIYLLYLVLGAVEAGNQSS